MASGPNPRRVLKAMGDPARDASTAEAVDVAAGVLAAGGTAVIPTDTVYGLAAVAINPVAVAHVFELKGRPSRQPLAVLVADAAQARLLIEEPPPPVRSVMSALWPGALTLVLARRADRRHVDLGGDSNTVGVRCPASRVARAIAAKVGPIATTSANQHGSPTPHEAGEAASALKGVVDVILDGGPCLEPPSTVVDVTGDEWQLLRAGPVRFEEVLAAAGSSPPDRRRR